MVYLGQERSGRSGRSILKASLRTSFNSVSQCHTPAVLFALGEYKMGETQFSPLYNVPLRERLGKEVVMVGRKNETIRLRKSDC